MASLKEHFKEMLEEFKPKQKEGLAALGRHTYLNFMQALENYLNDKKQEDCIDGKTIDELVTIYKKFFGQQFNLGRLFNLLEENKSTISEKGAFDPKKILLSLINFILASLTPGQDFTSNLSFKDIVYYVNKKALFPNLAQYWEKVGLEVWLRQSGVTIPPNSNIQFLFYNQQEKDVFSTIANKMLELNHRGHLHDLEELLVNFSSTFSTLEIFNSFCFLILEKNFDLAQTEYFLKVFSTDLSEWEKKYKIASLTMDYCRKLMKDKNWEENAKEILEKVKWPLLRFSFIFLLKLEEYQLSLEHRKAIFLFFYYDDEKTGSLNFEKIPKDYKLVFILQYFSVFSKIFSVLENQNKPINNHLNSLDLFIKNSDGIIFHLLTHKEMASFKKTAAELLILFAEIDDLNLNKYQSYFKKECLDLLKKSPQTIDFFYKLLNFDLLKEHIYFLLDHLSYFLEGQATFNFFNQFDEREELNQALNQMKNATIQSYKQNFQGKQLDISTPSTTPSTSNTATPTALKTSDRSQLKIKPSNSDPSVLSFFGCASIKAFVKKPKASTVLPMG